MCLLKQTDLYQLLFQHDCLHTYPFPNWNASDLGMILLFDLALYRYILYFFQNPNELYLEISAQYYWFFYRKVDGSMKFQDELDSSYKLVISFHILILWIFSIERDSFHDNSHFPLSRCISIEWGTASVPQSGNK